MVKLFEQDIKREDRQSSKGNQLKWMYDNKWYKSDYTGYEGLAEYVVSKLLIFSTLQKNEFVEYESVNIDYNQKSFAWLCQSKLSAQRLAIDYTRTIV